MNDCWVSSDNKEIIIADRFGDLLKHPNKKYRLEAFNKAHDRLTEMNRRINDPENKGLK